MAAGDKTVSLTVLERNWLAKSIATQRGVLQRSLSKEMPGSEIYVLRQKEIQALQDLAVKLEA